MELELLLRKRFFEKANLMMGPYFYHYSSKYSDNAGTVLGQFRQLHLDSADIFSNKSYGGGKFALSIDNRNKEFFPTRGILWYNELTALTGITKGSDDYIKFTSDMSIYASLREAAKLVAILKVGWGHIFTKKYEYFQAMTLGANNTLNGFRKNRYSGSSSFYSSMELKMKLAEVNSFILPGTLGLTTFYDIGRVWWKGGEINPGPGIAAMAGDFIICPLTFSPFRPRPGSPMAKRCSTLPSAPGSISPIDTA